MLFSGSSAKRMKCMKDNVHGGHAHMAHVSIRHAEPEDCEALHQIFSGPRVIEGTDRRYAFPKRCVRGRLRDGKLQVTERPRTLTSTTFGG